ncbi:MAG: multidrug transporter, partial [Acidobacteriota bacterium]|nr:multidrug transporter [Acidobacteriota bacterium]
MRRGLLGAAIAALVAGVAWYAFHAYRNITTVKADVIPAAKVIRGDVTLAVTARGELRGGNPLQLSAPSTGGDMHLVELRTTGSPVKKGEVVAQFDTTEQEFKL